MIRTSAGYLARRPLLALAILVLAVVAIWIISPGLFTEANPVRGDISDKLLPPSLAHPFGTDTLGRDVYARVVHGAALSLGGAVVAVIVATALAIVIGGTAGYLEGRIDTAVMRLVDIALAVPGLLIALIIIAILGPGTINVAVAVGIASAAGLSRIMRADVRAIRTAAYVEQARAFSAGHIRVVLTHVIPNAAPPVLSLVIPELAGAILTVSALSFLGFGAQPPTPEWGALIADGRNQIASAWWLVTIPSIVVLVFVLALFIIGTGIRRVLRERSI